MTGSYFPDTHSHSSPPDYYKGNKEQEITTIGEVEMHSESEVQSKVEMHSVR